MNTEPKLNHGEVPSFRLKSWLDCVYALIDADEVERALWMLNNLPAYYRDNEPYEVTELRQKVLKALITTHGYMTANFDNDIYDSQKAINILRYTLRGHLITKELFELRKLGLTAHIVDVGPGEYWLPTGLLSLGYEFAYTPISVDQKAKAQFEAKNHKFLEPDNKMVKVFVGLEVIEHLSDTTQLSWEAYKHLGRHPDIVHLSTPLYTFDANPKDWETMGLPHLRAYTPDEFYLESLKVFPKYHSQIFLDAVMSVRLVHHAALSSIAREFSTETLSDPFK